MNLTPEDWERIRNLCRQVLDAGEKDYGYIHDNGLKLDDIIADSYEDPDYYYLKKKEPIFDKAERSKLWASAVDKEWDPVKRALFFTTLEEVKAATISRIERSLGRSITDL
ncbi:MAG: hypothetical protein JST45_09900 [Bacteroidetes bacterium]|nr:hypothetical protein [Bacteroidota bacterium]